VRLRCAIVDLSRQAWAGCPVRREAARAGAGEPLMSGYNALDGVAAIATWPPRQSLFRQRPLFAEFPGMHPRPVLDGCSRGVAFPGQAEVPCWQR
jgi:hypothetical protein